MSEYVQAFFTVPFRVMQLPGLTIQLLRFYETIFHFWHTGNQCFLKNDALKERASMKSDSTIAAAFQYFEKHGEMKRVTKGGRRYIVQPVRVLETDSVDNSAENSTNTDQGLAVARGGSRCSEGEGLAVARHNKNKVNNLKLSKSFCDKDVQKKPKCIGKDPPENKPVISKRETWKEANQKKHAWASKKESPRADVTKQSNSYDPSAGKQKRGDPSSAGYQAFVDSVPHLRRKKERRQQESMTSVQNVSVLKDSESVGVG